MSLIPFQVKDTIEKMYMKDIKDDCIVTESHLVAIVEVTGLNLFEMESHKAYSCLARFSNIVDELGFPCQLVTLSRPKSFARHLHKVKHSYAPYDYRLKFQKDKERFDMNYENDLKKKKITKEEIQKKFEEHPEYMNISMIDSYVKRVNTAVEQNDIKEKRHYVVISTLDISEDSVEEDKTQTYASKDYTNTDLFQQDKIKLDDRVDKTLGAIKTGGMAGIRIPNEGLENIVFDIFNFPLSGTNKINRYITDYPELPPILNDSSIDKTIKLGNRPLHEKIVETGLNALIAASNLGFQHYPNVKVKSNPILQLLKPYSIDDTNMEYVRINGQYLFTIHITLFGFDEFEDLVLWKILSSKYNYDLSVDIVPLDKNTFLSELEKTKDVEELDKQEKMKKSSSVEARLIEEDANININTFESFKDKLRRGKSNVFATSVDVTFRASNKEEMKEIKKYLRSELRQSKIFYSELTGLHYDGFISTSPLMINLVSGHKRPFKKIYLFKETLGNLFPFCPESVDDDDGMMLGIALRGDSTNTDKNIVFYDAFKRTGGRFNSNLFISGQSGLGKTVTLHDMIKNQMLLSYGFGIMDFYGNYYKWAKDMPDHVQVIRIDPSSSQKQNPCDIFIPPNHILEEHEDYAGKTEQEIKTDIINQETSKMMSYYKMFLGDAFNSTNGSILDIITKEVFSKRMESVDIYKTKIVEDILLKDIVIKAQEKYKSTSEDAYKEIAIILDGYASGSRSDMFNSKTNIDFDPNKTSVFYLAKNSEDSLLLSTFQAFLMMKRIILQSQNKFIMAIDELSKLFRIESTYINNFFEDQTSAIRNFGGGVWGATQFPNQINNISAGENFIKLSDTHVFLAGFKLIKDPENPMNLIIEDKFVRESVTDSSAQFIASHGKGHCVFKIGNDTEMHLKIENHPDLSLYKRYSPEASKHA